MRIGSTVLGDSVQIVSEHSQFYVISYTKTPIVDHDSERVADASEARIGQPVQSVQFCSVP